MNNKDKEKILAEMQKIAENSNLIDTGNMQKIANAKAMMFGLEEWTRCPCDGNNPNRYCISPLCLKDIKEKGRCHCSCYTFDTTDGDAA